MFVRITNGHPETYTIGELRRDNPQTSFPRDIPAEILAQFNVHKVKETPAPQLDSKTHRHTQSVELVDGEWTQAWSFLELPLTQASGNVRAHRDSLLQETDWVVVMHTERGTNIPMEWEVYRQALRDITNQADFPYKVSWPTKPE